MKDQYTKEDYQQALFKLKTDIEFERWEKAQKDLGFIKEIIQRLKEYQDKKDTTQMEYVFQMLEDWRYELQKVVD